MTTPTYSDDGTVWNLHRAGADPLPLAVEGADISADEVIFKVEGGPTVQFGPDPNNPTGKLLTFAPEDLAAMPARGAQFYVKNVTANQVYIDGKVFVRGFA